MIRHDQLARTKIFLAADLIAENTGSPYEGDEETEARVDGLAAGLLGIRPTRNEQMNDGKPHEAQNQRAHAKTHKTQKSDGRTPGDVEFMLYQRSISRSIVRRSKNSCLALPPESP